MDTPTPPPQRRRPHYGWWVLAIGWIVYGLGIAPGYYSWGQLLPYALEDLSLNRTQGGLVFGIFTLLYSGVAPLSGVLIHRFGVRAVMTLGGVIACIGFLVTSRAETLTHALVGFSVLGGLGIGLGVLLPSQTLGNNWFIRYRATAIAVLMTAGGIVGKAVPLVDEWMVANHTWREAWLLIAGCSAFVALLALVFVRNRPEDVGLHPDNRFEPAPAPVPGSLDRRGVDPDWNPRDALRTPQFLALIFCGIAFATPWGVAVSHGPLHLGDLGISPLAGASIMGWMILLSIVGRLSGLIGDWVPPQRALALGLVLEAVGIVGLLRAPSQTAALLFACLLGLGFGTAYVCVSATFGAFFGRRAFSVTAGTRMMFTGIVNAAMPTFAGWSFDRSGSYLLPFLIVGSLAAAGACLAWVLRDPGPAPGRV